MTPLLEIAGLRRRFAERIVLDGLDLTMKPGQRVAVVGPNGSGKSTTLRCVAGTVAPTAGTIRIAGFASGTTDAQRRLGVSLSEARSFYLRISGRANLVFFARLRGFGPREAAEAVARLDDELALGDFLDQRADRYSTGMILQLGFARALLGDPPLLLLDEPTRSLDPEAADRLWAALDRRPHTGLLIATHTENDVGRCHSVVALER